ncbi:diheme cytochrome c-553 [Bacteroidota bacterium]
MKYKSYIYITISSVIFSLIVFMSCETQDNKEKTPKTPTKAELIVRGEYLTNFGGCHDCHTSKIFNEHGFTFDTTRALSGHPSDLEIPSIDKGKMGPGNWLLFNDNMTAAVGPWGLSYSANLTPDLETGIGRWSEDMFVQAMRTGKHMGAGRPILPPMPWESLEKLTDEDLKAIYLYLQSIKPIKNKVPDPVPPNEL